jgi:DNA-binding CsgD family transcriptional regulator
MPDRRTDVLRALYGLTAAEARVAISVIAGAGIIGAATTLAISPNTVKSHLARVFDKTGARSQSELATLLGQLPKTFVPNSAPASTPNGGEPDTASVPKTGLVRGLQDD